MKSLDNCGWPITQNDVYLMEEEIKQAQSYLQQSAKIRFDSRLQKYRLIWKCAQKHYKTTLK